MPLQTHTLKPAAGAAKKRKRIGRGNASGHGTYSGRGLKGQKSRSGVSGLKRKGMKQMLLRTPKKRGFTSLKAKAQIVKASAINNHYKNGEVVTAKSLSAKGLIAHIKGRIKILGPGEITVKGLRFQGVALSKSLVREKVAPDITKNEKSKPSA